MPVQIFYSLSERHTYLLDFSPSDVQHGSLPRTLTDALFEVVKHAAHLPPLNLQASQRDTALLVVSSGPDPKPLG